MASNLSFPGKYTGPVSGEAWASTGFESSQPRPMKGILVAMIVIN